MTDGREAATPATPAPLPAAQMREMLHALRAMAAEGPRTHALHWLVFQEFQCNPLMWQFTWQEAWMLHAQTALIGLLEEALEGRATPEMLMGIAGAIANLFGSAQAADRTWHHFLRTVPTARQEPTVLAFAERERAEGAALQALSRPAQMIHSAVMHALPVPARG